MDADRSGAVAMTDRYFVLGNPVAHSQSPFIHAEFARQTGQRLIYDRRLCALDGFARAVQELAADTHGGPVRGCNVTAPFKFEAFSLAARRSDRATLARAANVLCFDGPAWFADNTDGIGLVRDIEFNAARPIAGARVLVIGAGGAAAGVLGPLIEGRPSSVTVANRTPDRARDLVARHVALAQQHSVHLRATGLADAQQACDLVLNASSSSLAGSAAPVSAQVLAPGALAVDLMYGPLAAPFLAWARAHGAHSRDGLGMLVEQAAAAFELWRGIRPATAPVLEALRARLESGG
jgi:shikimate dehydrogenase